MHFSILTEFALFFFFLFYLNTALPYSLLFFFDQTAHMVVYSCVCVLTVGGQSHQAGRIKALSAYFPSPETLNITDKLLRRRQNVWPPVSLHTVRVCCADSSRSSVHFIQLRICEGEMSQLEANKNMSSSLLFPERLFADSGQFSL